jgi:hypothetical protein
MLRELSLEVSVPCDGIAGFDDIERRQLEFLPR